MNKNESSIEIGTLANNASDNMLTTIGAGDYNVKIDIDELFNSDFYSVEELTEIYNNLRKIIEEKRKIKLKSL